MSKADQLDSKRRRTERFRFEISDPTAAQDRLSEANLAVLRARKDTDELSAAQAELEAAQQALDACYGAVTVRALAPRRQLLLQQEQAERDAAAEAAHQAAVEAAKEAGEDPPAEPDSTPTWEADSFEVRFIAACDADGRSPERWAEVLDMDGDWTLDDRDALLRLCFEVNTRRAFNPAVLGKGWAARRS